jgi:hypothetical protein
VNVSGSILHEEIVMREIMRREVLMGEVLPLVVFAVVVLLVFMIVLANSQDIDEATAALLWTLRAVGALIAVVAAFGLFWRVINGESLERQFGFVMVLLAGLLLIDVHWSLAIVLGAIGVALIVRAIILREYTSAPGATTGFTSPVDPRIE